MGKEAGSCLRLLLWAELLWHGLPRMGLSQECSEHLWALCCDPGAVQLPLAQGYLWSPGLQAAHGR